MTLHPAKETALINVCNCVSYMPVPIPNIKALTDGKFLLALINATFSLFSKEVDEDKAESGDNKGSKEANVIAITSEEVITENVIKSKNVDTENVIQFENVDTENVIKSENVDTENVIKSDNVNAESAIKSKDFDTEAVLNSENVDTKNVDMKSENMDFQSTATINKDINIENIEMDVEYDNVVKTESSKVVSSENVSAVQAPETLEDPGQKSKRRFECVEMFIDERYNLKSGEIISYSCCMQSDALELAKVAIFVVSEIVKHYVTSNNVLLETLSHLDPAVQEDLEHCFRLFITNRTKISKKEVEQILCNPAKYKVEASPRSNFATPQRNCQSLFRRRAPAKTPEEEVFSNSPLKLYFESPVFRKEDIILKDREIQKVKKILLEEEFQKEDLQRYILELIKQGEERDKDYINLKNRCKELQRKYDSKEELYNELLATYEKLRKEQNEKDQTMNNTRSEFYVSQIMDLRRQLAECEEKNHQLTRDFQNLQNKKETKEEIVQTDYDVDETVKKLKESCDYYREKLEEAAKNESLLKAKVCDYKAQTDRVQESEVCGENIGEILIEEEKTKILRLLKKAELEIEELKRRLEYKDSNLSCSDENVAVTRPELLSMSRFSETEKFRDSVRHSGIYDELNDSLERCILNNSDVTAKLSVSSSHLETRNFAECIQEASMSKNLDSQRESERIFDTSCMVIDHDINVPDFEGKRALTFSQQNAINFPKHKPEAVLWNTYDSEHKSDNSFEANCVNEDHNLSIPKKTGQLVCVDRASEMKIDGTTVHNSLQSADIFETLDFNSFFNSLKALSTNGSYKKVTEVFERLKSDFKSQKSSKINVCNVGDLQVLLNLVTDIISVAPSRNVLDKNSKSTQVHSGNESEASDFKSHHDIESLVHQISEMTRKHSREVSSLKMKNHALERKCKDIIQRNVELTQRMEDLEARHDYQTKDYEQNIADFKKKLHDIEIRYIKKRGKCIQLGEIARESQLKLEKLESEHSSYVTKCKEHQKREKYEILSLQKKIHEATTYRKKLEKTINKLINDKKELEGRSKELESKINDLKGVSSVEAQTGKNSMEIESAIPKKCIKVGENLNSTCISELPSQERSVSALFSQSFQLDYEKDFNYDKLIDLKDIKEDEDRAEELKHRNSILPFHLQSSYPVEGNLPSSNSLYVRDEEKVIFRRLRESTAFEEGYANKKRKYEDAESQIFSTPVTKGKKTFKTPSSLKKLLLLKRNRCSGFVKPKP